MGGGVDKSHGVGLTSGLTRTVPPQRGPMPQGFQTGGQVMSVGHPNYPKVIGPDGQPREGHRLGAIKGILSALAPGLRTAFQAAKSGVTSGGKGFKDWWKYGQEGTKTIAARKADLAAAAKAAREALAKTKGLGSMNVNVAAGEAAMAAKLAKQELLKQFGKSGTKGISGLAGQTGRTLGMATPLAYGYGALPSSITGDLEYDADKSIMGNIGTFAQDYARLPTQIGLSGYDLLSGKGEDWWDNISGYGPASQSWFGTSPREAAEEEAAITHDTKPMEIASKMEQQEALRQQYLDKIELYKELLGADTDQNNLGTISDALMQAGTALTEGQGWTGAMQAGYKPLSAENIRRRDRKSGINEAAVTQAFSDIAGSQSFIDQANIEAIAQGETDLPFKLKAQTDAHAAGIGTINHILDDDGEIDMEKLSDTPGMIYFDVDKIAGGGYYVAVNMDGEAQSFDNIEDAEAWMNSRST